MAFLSAHSYSVHRTGLVAARHQALHPQLMSGVMLGLRRFDRHTALRGIAGMTGDRPRNLPALVGQPVESHSATSDLFHLTYRAYLGDFVPGMSTKRQVGSTKSLDVSLP